MKKLAVILLTIALIGTVFAGCKAKPEEESSTAADTSTSQQAVTDTTAADTTETTAAETSAEVTQDNTPAFIKDGCWYFYEEEDKMAYAFSFGENGKADIAYFNRENVEGEDAKFFEGNADYTVDGDKLTVSNIPAAVGFSTMELTIDGDSLNYNGIKLEKEDKISLDYPFEHFNS